MAFNDSLSMRAFVQLQKREPDHVTGEVVAYPLSGQRVYVRMVEQLKRRLSESSGVSDIYQRIADRRNENGVYGAGRSVGDDRDSAELRLKWHVRQALAIRGEDEDIERRVDPAGVRHPRHMMHVFKVSDLVLSLGRHRVTRFKISDEKDHDAALDVAERGDQVIDSLVVREPPNETDYSGALVDAQLPPTHVAVGDVVEEVSIDAVPAATD